MKLKSFYGTVNYCSNSSFSLPLGAELEIIHGTIN